MKDQPETPSAAAGDLSSPDAPTQQPSTAEPQDPVAELILENMKMRELLLRRAAEFDNYRKRSEREISSIIQKANADLVLALLPVLDDLERILTAGPAVAEAGPLLEGIKLVHKNFSKVLQDAGLTAMAAVDQPFDPEKHDALLHVPVAGKEPNLVVEEHKKGYEFRDRVIRHAQVIVSK